VTATLSIVAIVLVAVAISRRLIEFALFGVKALLLSGHGEDQWLYVYLLRTEIERVLGIDGGGIWNGWMFYPLHETSLLLTEPQWGVSLALLPFWLLSRDEFLTLGIGATGALLLGWIGAWAFARHLGASRLAAAVAALALGTSGAFTALLIRPFFWPFPLVILILYAADRVALGGGRRWIVAFALLFGALAWSSGHLTVMAIALVAAQVGFVFHARVAAPGAWKRLLAAAAGAAALAAIPIVQQMLVLSRHGFTRPLAIQAANPPNLSSFIGGYWSWVGLSVVNLGLPPPTGELVVGLPPFALAFATIAFAVRVARVDAGPPRPLARIAALAALGAIPGVVAAVALPDRIAGCAIDRTATALFYGAAGAVFVPLARRLAETLRSPAGWFYAAAAAFAVLAIGPFFRLGDDRAIPSPALLVCRLPGFVAIRSSVRWSLACAFCLAISTALALAGRRSWARTAGTLALLLALVLDTVEYSQRPMPYLPPASTTGEIRAVDAFLRDAPGPGAVIELPVYATQREGERMVQRFHHRRPLVNGYGGMVPAFFERHWIPPADEFYARGTMSPANVELLRGFGARFWVVHRNELAPNLRANVPDSFGPVRKVAAFEAGQVIVYEDPDPRARTE
jgi:hypothetical protein